MALAITRTELLRLRLRSHGLTRPPTGSGAGVSGVGTPGAAVGETLDHGGCGLVAGGLDP